LLFEEFFFSRALFRRQAAAILRQRIAKRDDFRQTLALLFEPVKRAQRLIRFTGASINSRHEQR
jgi:hypothetical protein